MNFNGRFPPGFEDNALVFGAALFALLLVSSICVALIYSLLMEGRRGRYVDRMLGNPLASLVKEEGVTPLQLYRFKIICLLTTILSMSAPRVATLLMWREQPPDLLIKFFFAERVFSFLSIVPFLAFVGTHVWSGQAVGHALSEKEQMYIVLKPRWKQARSKILIVVWSAMIALGVTLYRMGAG